jgi:hypothetical protein
MKLRHTRPVSFLSLRVEDTADHVVLGPTVVSIERDVDWHRSLGTECVRRQKSLDHLRSQILRISYAHEQTWLAYPSDIIDSHDYRSLILLDQTF